MTLYTTNRKPRGRSRTHQSARLYGMSDKSVLESEKLTSTASPKPNWMALLCGMSTIQFSARSARSFVIYCLSLFRHVAVLTFAVLVCRRFDVRRHQATPTFRPSTLWHVVSLVNERRTSQRIWRGFFYGACEFPAICNHCGVMAAWSRKALKFVRNFAFFWKKTSPYNKICKILFRKFSSRHRSTIKFRVIWPTGNRWNRELFTSQITKFCLPLQRIAPKIFYGQPRTMYS